MQTLEKTHPQLLLVPIVEAIASQPVGDASCLHQPFPEAEQIAFSLKVIEQLGYGGGVKTKPCTRS